MEGGGQENYFMSLDWDEWADSVEGRVGDLDQRCQTLENKPGSTDFILGQLQSFEKTLDEKVSKSHGDFLNFLQQNVQQMNEQTAALVERERKKIQDDLSQALNNFILTCQQSGETVRNLADVQKGLLEAEIQRLFNSKLENFQKEMGDALRRHLDQCRKFEESTTKKLQFFETSMVQMNDFVNAFDGWWARSRADLLSSLVSTQQVHTLVEEKTAAADQHLKEVLARDIQSVTGTWGASLREVETKWQKFMMEKFAVIQDHLGKAKEAFTKLEMQQKLQEEQLKKLEGFLGAQPAITLDKVVDLMNKTEETIQRQVRQEIALQCQRNLETMVTKLLEERLKQTEREEHREDIKKSLQGDMQKQLGLILAKVGNDFEAERGARKKLEQEFAELKKSKDNFKVPQPVAKKLSKPPVVVTSTNVEEVEIFTLCEPNLHKGGRVAPVMEEIEIFSIVGMEPVSDRGGNTVEIRPVHVDTSPLVAPTSAAALQHIMRNMEVPKFSGKAPDWTQFRVDWEIYITKLSAALRLDEDCKMEILERSMDSINQMDLQSRRMERGRTLKYSEELCRLEGKYGRDQGLCLRKKWEEIKLEQQGRVTMQEWDEFQIRFRSLWKQIKDATPDEAKRLLMHKLPPFIFSWVVEEEDRRTNETPKFSLTVPSRFTEVSVSASLRALLGFEPTKVSKIGEGKFEIILSNTKECEKLQTLHGKEIQGTGCSIHIHRLIFSFDVEEACAFVDNKMALRNKHDMMWGRSAEKDNRTVRAASAEPLGKASTLQDFASKKAAGQSQNNGQPHSEPTQENVSPRRNSGVEGGGQLIIPPTQIGGYINTEPNSYYQGKGKSGGGGQMVLSQNVGYANGEPSPYYPTNGKGGGGIQLATSSNQHMGYPNTAPLPYNPGYGRGGGGQGHWQAGYRSNGYEGGNQWNGGRGWNNSKGGKSRGKGGNKGGQGKGKGAGEQEPPAQAPQPATSN
jgi:hypothetical protein